MIKLNSPSRTPALVPCALALGLTSMSALAVTPEQNQFFASLASHCGKAFEGKVVSTDAADTKFAKQKLVMHVRECGDTQLKIPFHVGEDRSRTWILTKIATKTASGLRLKHDHRHKDGSSDAVTMYGGDTNQEGSAELQSFPVDKESIANFNVNGLKASVTNTWQMGVTDKIFSYRMFREGRDFKVEFDLSQPITPPPPPWGEE